MLRLHIKRAVKGLVFLFIAVLIWTLAVNVVLLTSRKMIVEDINRRVQARVHIESIFYIFPHTLHLHKASIAPRGGKPADQVLIRSLQLRISLNELILKRGFKTDTVKLDRFELGQPFLKDMIRDNAAAIFLFLRNARQTDMKFSIRRFLLNTENGQSLNDIDIKIKKGELWGRGVSQGKMDGRMGDPARFYFTGRFTPGGVNFEKILIGRSNLYAQLWGETQGISLKLKGFVLTKNMEKNTVVRDGAMSRKFTMPEEFTDADNYILDIDSQFILKFPLVEVPRIKFSYNNIPVDFKGSAVFGRELKIKLEGKVTPKNQEESRKAGWRAAGGSIDGVWDDNNLRGKGSVYLRLYKEPDSETQYSPEKLSLEWEEMNAVFFQEKRVDINLVRPRASFWTNENAHTITFDHINADARLAENRSPRLEFDGVLYGGRMKGTGRIDTGAAAVKVSSEINFHDVEALELDDLSVYFAKVAGKLSGHLELTNDPELLINGLMNIRQGRLTEFAFFQWLGDTFSLPSLKNVDFDELAAEFMIDTGEIQLSNINLQSVKARLSGFFNVNQNQYVTSQLTLDLGRELLQESPKLRRLLNGLGVDVPSLNFDFRLSGKQQAMNFQWEQTDFKKRIQANMPNILEWKIEKDLDEVFKEK